MKALSIAPQPEKAHSPETTGLFFSLIITKPIDPQTVETTVKNISEVLDEEMPQSYEIIVMDSDTSSLEAATQVAEKYPTLRVFKYTGNTPVAAGWEQASGNVLGIIDGDLVQPPTSLSDLIKDIKSGSDISVTSQYKDGKPDGGDPDLSFMAIRKQALPKLNESSKGYQLMLEMMGPENIRKMADDKMEDSNSGRILSHLKNIIGF